jgi:hypothetical protein
MVILHFEFWPQEAKKKKNLKSLIKPHEDNKFYILDETKHDFEIFGILHSTIPK